MQNNDEKRSIELETKQKSGVGKIIVAAVVLVAAYFGYGSLTSGDSSQQNAQSDAITTVMVQSVEKADASAVASEYVGRVEAIQTVQVKPQISGEILKVCFKEGSVVKAGQTLFRIDPVQYEATVQLRKAELERARANLDAAEKFYARVKAAEPRAVSEADRDTAESNVLQGRAAVSEAKANLRLAQIDLGYCEVKSPITGKIGVAVQTKGNYVTPQSGALATIVQMDPIRVSYTLPDRDYLDQLGEFKKNGAVYKTKLILSNGSEFAAQGERDFEDNTVDQTTGTVMMRLRYANADGVLIPGEMVRVFTNPVSSRVVDVVPQTAVMADADGDYVFVVDDGDVIRQTRVTLGRELGSGREVVSGLKEGDRVATAGLQYLRDGMKVRVNEAQAASGGGAASPDATEEAK